jgi:hypothetical protein
VHQIIASNSWQNRRTGLRQQQGPALPGGTDFKDAWAGLRRGGVFHANTIRAIVQNDLHAAL